MRSCIMGCRLTEGQRVHVFPQEVKRRAEWFRILGINPVKKNVYLCDRHIPYYFIQGNRVSRFTIPNPPELTKSVYHFSSSYDDSITENIEKEVLKFSDDVQFPEEEKQEEEKAQETQKNTIENFEIRKCHNHDVIIKGRCIQTENYLMVSYTPPRKWSLQKQVKLLDNHCTEQLKQIKQINKQNALLRTELKKYVKLLPKLRFLQRQNRLLYARLKMYKLKEKAARKRKMREKLIKLDDVKLDPNSAES